MKTLPTGSGIMFGYCKLAIYLLIAAGCIPLLPGTHIHAQSMQLSDIRQQARSAYQAGNYRDALQAYENFLTRGEVSVASDDREIGQDLSQALACIARLNELKRFDQFIESAVDTHSASWRLLWSAANAYSNAQHNGTIIAGDFERGYHRGGGRYVDATQRDRVRALQLYNRAWTLLKAQTRSDAQEAAIRTVLQSYSQALQNVGYRQSWRLQRLTDLSSLPDYDEAYYNNSYLGAPVDGDGNIITYKIPSSFADAGNDGERWRFVLNELDRLDTNNNRFSEWAWADFLWREYGVQTLAESLNQYFFNQVDDDNIEAERNLLNLENLGDTETIARLANGIQRFDLPDDYRFIEQFESLTQSGVHQLNALRRLAEIYENRRQWEKAADFWRRAIAINNGQRQYSQQRLDQIVGAWAQFEPLPLQANQANNKIVNLRFRNANSIKFSAYRILTAEFLNDLKTYLKSNPEQLEHEKLNLVYIGHHLLDKGDQYRGRLLRSWTETLAPAPRHQDKHFSLNLPSDLKGPYLLEGEVSGGNTSYIVVWNADAIIVKRPMENSEFYYLANAQTGEPLPNQDLHFFGYEMQWQYFDDPNQNRNRRELEISTQEFAVKTDAAGQVVVDSKTLLPNFQWLVHTDSANDAFAFMGFQSIWYGQRQYWPDQQTKAYVITNQPVYRPGQAVEIKAWARTASYTQLDHSQLDNPHANRELRLRVRSPRGEKIIDHILRSDDYGGIQYSLALPDNADLGAYGVEIVGYSGYGQFRVEEYKKPEYEVSIEKPEGVAALGDTIHAKIKANYYFGAPVTNATVKIKVMRHEHNAQWFPGGPWDWLYGRGYWWFACDMHWLPGFRDWGISAPRPSWFPYYSPPPELVQENELSIGTDGSVEIAINTEAALLLHGDKNHRYSISAEVIDQSRRSVYASGDILVARQAFQVYTWVDRGFYQLGDTIEAQFKAQTLDEVPVQGEGEVELYRIHYSDNNEVTETLVQTWALNTNSEGSANLIINADAIGQHRIRYRLQGPSGNRQEGAYVFNVIGANNSISDTDEDNFRFNELELIADASHYGPGDTLQLMINSRRDNAKVLVFSRPYGNYQLPSQLNLAGNSRVMNIDIDESDHPNFFVEALTVFEGKVYTQVKEIAVPPKRSELSISLQADKEDYRPGDTVEIDVAITDQEGEPKVGSTVITVYDKALDYIADNNGPPNIRDFFWQWKRYHTPNDQHSANLASGNIVAINNVFMQPIGVFGDRVIESNFASGALDEVVVTGSMLRSNKTRQMRGFGATPEPAPPPAPMMAMAAPLEDQALPEVTIRSEFADAVYWNGNVITDKEGHAKISFTMPDNLTTWKASVWSIGEATEVGQGQTELITSKKLLVRLQAPRFFIEKDEVVLSANVHNYLDNAEAVKVRLELDGEQLELLSPQDSQIRIDANGEQRVDWRVKVANEGMASIRMLAVGENESDAVAMEFPVYVHGQLITQSFSGALNSQQNQSQIQFTVPAQRRAEQTLLELRYSPSLAGAMVDALPYLADYPYGCTEQTLSRFLPTVLVHQVLQKTGIDLAAINTKQTNLNAQEIGDDKERAAQWGDANNWRGGFARKNPVFDEDEIMTMVKSGMARLTSMQLSDGGWGWFSGWGEHSSPHTTAYVVRGLLVAKNAGLAVDENSLQRGLNWLSYYQDQELQKLRNAVTNTKPYKSQADNIDALLAMVLAEADTINTNMLDLLYRDRLRLAVYSQSMLALTMHKANRLAERDQIRGNIEQYLIRDAENQTAYLNLNNGAYWWYWYGSEFEAHAYYLKLLAQIDPSGDTAPALVKYLLNNRKNAHYWNSTRDTALVIEAMADYFVASGEAAPDLQLDVLLDGEILKTVSLTADNLFQFDNKLILQGLELSSGQHTLELKKRGNGPLYYNAYLSNFSTEDKLQKAGLELKVERRYFKLEKINASQAVAGSIGQALNQSVEKYQRIPINEETELQSGDLVEIELLIDSKNDYEYILIEDMKAAGFEPISVRSGYLDYQGKGNELGAYVEYRDNRVAFFAQHIARGTHSLSYRMKAEVPGRFSALPTKIEAMYAPELKANSDENKLFIGFND